MRRRLEAKDALNASIVPQHMLCNLTLSIQSTNNVIERMRLTMVNIGAECTIIHLYTIEEGLIVIRWVKALAKNESDYVWLGLTIDEVGYKGAYLS